MVQVARRVHHKRVLRLIRRYLEAGVMAGLVQPSEEGTPQGSPRSPLLSNVLLDDLDWELERRGHRFVRYADDTKIYVRSERVGQRVMESITWYVERRLKLRVNAEKSAVDSALERPLLGFQFFARETTRSGSRVASKARKRAKDRLRRLTTRNWGVSMERRIRETTASRSVGRHTSPSPTRPRCLRGTWAVASDCSNQGWMQLGFKSYATCAAELGVSWRAGGSPRPAASSRSAITSAVYRSAIHSDSCCRRFTHSSRSS
jgi:hypothetical protein